eukprot:364831-Chlamydomonas_euryale.AAC.8
MGKLNGRSRIPVLPVSRRAGQGSCRCAGPPPPVLARCRCQRTDAAASGAAAAAAAAAPAAVLQCCSAAVAATRMARSACESLRDVGGVAAGATATGGSGNYSCSRRRTRRKTTLRNGLGRPRGVHRVGRSTTTVGSRPTSEGRGRRPALWTPRAPRLCRYQRFREG